jgi:hypothetical protein
MGLLDVHCTYESIFAALLKRSSFWASADPVSNDLVHAMPGCACLLSLCVYYDLYCESLSDM